MRSRPERLAPSAIVATTATTATTATLARLAPAAVLVAVVVAAVMVAPGRAQEPGALPIAAGEAPSRDQAQEAMAAVQAELSPTRKVRTLRWNGPQLDEASDERGGVEWLAELFSLIAQSARLLIWATAMVLLALLAYYGARLLRGVRVPKGYESVALPTHVQELDIRPESLPADVGAAARALWDSAERRAALALLYRGLLSRLVHAHAVPIRESSTEGDALALASPVIGERRRNYAARLVLTWQRAVYGHDEPDTLTVHELCADFGPLLDPPPVTATPPGANA